MSKPLLSLPATSRQFRRLLGTAAGFALMLAAPAVAQAQTVYGLGTVTTALNPLNKPVGTQLIGSINANTGVIDFFGTKEITGITAGQVLVGMDSRPATGQLFVLGYDANLATSANSQLYTLNPATGAAAPVGSAFRLELGGPTERIGFDFNPTVDRIRVVSSYNPTTGNTNNYRLNPNPGTGGAIAVINDGVLNYASGNPADPNIGAVAYTNSVAGATTTTLYDIDETAGLLVVQTSPNGGTLGSTTPPVVSPVNITFNGAPFGTKSAIDFDIVTEPTNGVQSAYLIEVTSGGSTNFYNFNLATGAATSVGSANVVPSSSGVEVRDIAAAILPAVTGRLLYGVANGNLISFDSGAPGAIRSTVAITGLPASQVLAGTDFRPATGELFALGYDATNSQGQIYTLNLSTGALTAVGGLNAMTLGASASGIGFDFNPVADRIRVVGSNGNNYRLTPGGALATPNDGATGRALSATAYTNNDNNANTGTTQYGYDQTNNQLVRFSDSNAGTNTTVGGSNITVNTANGVDFDIYSDLSNAAVPMNMAFAVAAPGTTTSDVLYSVDLTSGAFTSLGQVGSGLNLSGLAAFLTPGPTIAAGLTWTGAVSTDWGTAGNWSPAQVPTATDNVTIPDLANDPVVSNAQQANGVTLLSGATLTTANGGTLTVNGSFTNNGGTTLGAGTGTVVFAGTAAQTISGSTTFFNNLTAGSAGVVAAGPVQVQRVLTLNGNLTSNGNLTLLSNATGTAHVINNGSNMVTGNATVQRYIDNTLYNGAGYRHFSSPVNGNTFADLTTGSFTPVVNPDYNTQGNTVTPFPTVFSYNQSRVNTSGNPAPQDFDKGFQSPAALSDLMVLTSGYTVNIPAGLTPDFVGALNNGTITRAGLSRGTQTESGWQLLGNPYPAPLNWDLVGRSNVDAAVYVYRATGPYAGTYSAYVANGTGTNGGTNVIGSAQGFFVRVTTPGSSNGQVSFSNAARFTTYQSPVFQRSVAISGPLVRLSLQAATGPADEAVVYLEPGATTGFDTSLDAYKLLAGGTPVLASQLDATTRLAVNALPPLAAATSRVVELTVQAQQPGSHTLQATELLNLSAGTYAYLRDAVTGAVIDLQVQPSYTFTLASTALTTGRFSLVLTQNRVLATNAPAQLSQQIGLYPNPARGSVALSLPAALDRQPLAVSVLNALGQQVLTRALPANRGAEPVALPLAGLAKGVYTVRLTTPQGLVAKRLVVE